MSENQNGTWFAETIRASGNYPAINRPDTRPYQTKACQTVKKPLQRRSHPHKTLVASESLSIRWDNYFAKMVPTFRLR